MRNYQGCPSQETPLTIQNKVKPRGGGVPEGPKTFWRAAGAPEKIGFLIILPLEIAIFEPKSSKFFRPPKAAEFFSQNPEIVVFLARICLIKGGGSCKGGGSWP